jgi:hypothetical protein
MAILLSQNALAQINSGVVTGVVTDPQKAVVPNAKVELVEDATEFAYSAITNSSGEFTVPYLKAGIYTLTVTTAGFPVHRLTGLNVVPESTLRADVTLRLSSVATQVEVLATADQLQTDSTTVESAVGEKIIDSTPNITQNPLYYATLMEGVVGRTEMTDSTSVYSFGIGYTARRYQSAINVDGASAFTAGIQLDGLSTTSGSWNAATVLPNTDSLQEVRVVSSNFTAETGRGMGAIKMTTKSGTNQFHGSLYDRDRNEALNANTFINNADSIARTAFKVQDFGGTVGGPILKNKLFFFTSYELMIHNDTPYWMLTVPTAAQRIGDFSQTMTSGVNGAPTLVGIWDPNSATPVAGQTNVYARNPYPNNIIPMSEINPAALKLMAIYPLPNRTPTDAFGSNNFYTQANRPFQRSSNNSRMDYHLAKHSIYASGGVSLGSINTPSPYGPNSPWFGNPTNNTGNATRYITDDNPYVQLGDTVILSPTLVLDVRAGVTRIHANALGNAPNTDFTPSDYDSYGIPRSVQAIMPVPGEVPDLNTPGFFSNPSWTQYGNKKERETNSQASGSITKMHGKWTLKAGSEYRVFLINSPNIENAASVYGVGPGSYTVEYINATGGSVQNNNINQQGFSGANILAGGGGWTVPPGFGMRPALTSKYLGFYTQNDWHATSRLTLNLGLRWELQPGPTDRFNRSSALDLNEPSPFTASGSPLNTPYMGAVVFPGKNGLSRNLWQTTWTNFGPRLGAAYHLGTNWVIRGGYGLAYAANNTGWDAGPFSFNMGAFDPGTQVLPYGNNPNGNLVGHFYDAAASPVIPVVGPNSAAPQLYGTGNSFMNYNSERPSRIDMWNVYIERQLSRNWFVSAGYVGTRGSNLVQARYSLQNNQDVPASVLASCRQTWIATSGTNPCAANVQNPLQPTGTAPLIPFTGTLGQRTIPMVDTYYPYLALLGGLIFLDQGWSNYQALNLRVRHSFANGFLLAANYTWSKSIDTAYTEAQDEQGFGDGAGGNAGQSYNQVDLLNPYNNKKLSFSDVPQRVVITGVYELPFGRGKQVAIHNRVASAALSGWRVGGVYTFQMGFPLGAGGLNGNSLDSRADVNPGEPLVLPASYQHWYDGKTTVTLPDGRQYTPCAQCFLKFNPDAFMSPVATLANGSHQADLYWTGNAAIDYGAMRGPGRNNVDLTLTRDFSIRDRYGLSFMASATNAFNHTQFLPGSYTMALGSVQVTSIPAQGIVAGESQATTTGYGTHNLNTFSPRQMILEMRLRF